MSLCFDISKLEKLTMKSQKELSGRCISGERKRPYSRMLYLVLFDIFFEIESVTLYSKFEIKIKIL
jgi:hypothetical protein